MPLGPVSGRVRDGEILVWVSEGIWRGSEFCWSSIGSGKAGGPSPKPPSVRLYPILDHQHLIHHGPLYSYFSFVKNNIIM